MVVMTSLSCGRLSFLLSSLSSLGFGAGPFMIGRPGCQSSGQQSEVTGGGQVLNSRTGEAEGRVVVSGNVVGGSGSFVFIFRNLERTSGLVRRGYLMGRLGQLFLRWPYYNLASHMLVTSLSVITLFLTPRRLPWILRTNPLLECRCHLELGCQTGLWTAEKGQTARVEGKLR